MNKFWPVLAAFIQIACSGNIFKTSSAISASGPIFSSIVFLTAIFKILLYIQLYPQSLRKLIIIDVSTLLTTYADTTIFHNNKIK